MPAQLNDHDIVPFETVPGVRYEKRPARLPNGSVAEGLFNAWIWLDNPSQYNSYTTDMVKGLIRAFRAASNARDVVAVVFTGVGDKAFCTGGNTKEYAEYYAGQSAGIPAIYAPFQRHGVVDPGLRQACDRARQRHAHRRRPGNRHGLRFHRSRKTSPASARPARSTARLP